MNIQLVFVGWLLAKIRPFDSIFAKIHETRRAEKISSDTEQNPSKIEMSDKNKNLSQYNKKAGNETAGDFF